MPQAAPLPAFAPEPAAEPRAEPAAFTPEPPGEITLPRRGRSRRRAGLEAQKRSFLRMASHELRTPLNSILGFSEIISEELYGPLGAPQYREYAEIIRASGHRLLKLVNQILEIARLEGQAMDLSPRRESLDHALDDALDSLREDVSTRRTQVVVRDEGRLPHVRADPRGLRTVLTNLIQNAVVFSPQDALVTVEVRALAGHVEIRIRDAGPGVDPQDIPRLLRPFEQGDNALTRRSEGAGLGLPIAALLCEAMGGRLKLDSAPGEGLTALVVLPAA
ncbi:sensor histidine kinase KdpD [Phenylobacterium aquaticum]|uniref:sensor histidine kinase n=1 Tax=Phenylobacterium aquaticum TaxID=1763816 RepID=UPI0026EB32B3|nr:HAMP domain-containing sensor histidine kinase [Phenylobacterium aquaticum]